MVAPYIFGKITAVTFLTYNMLSVHNH